MEPRPEIYPPWKAPFHYDRNGAMICDSNGQRVIDLRGWGYLTGKGIGAVGLPDNSATTIQDALGERVATLINWDAAGCKAGPLSDPIRTLLQAHDSLIRQGNDYAYFELAYTRNTGWMAWLCTNAKELDPRRTVLAEGQGNSPDTACINALAQLTPESRERRRMMNLKWPMF